MAIILWSWAPVGLFTLLFISLSSHSRFPDLWNIILESFIGVTSSVLRTGFIWNILENKKMLEYQCSAWSQKQGLWGIIAIYYSSET